MYISGCFTSSTQQIFSLEFRKLELFFMINKSIAEADVLHPLQLSPGCPAEVFGQEELRYGWRGQL